MANSITDEDEAKKVTVLISNCEPIIYGTGIANLTAHFNPKPLAVLQLRPGDGRDHRSLHT